MAIERGQLSPAPAPQLTEKTVFISGSVQGASNIRAAISRAVNRGFVRGIGQAVSSYLPQLARETGLFRQVVAFVVMSEAEQAKDGRILFFDMRRVITKIIAGVDYGRHHIDGTPHHPGRTLYENPNIEGTRPFITNDFLRLAFDNVKRKIWLELNAEGLDVSRGLPGTVVKNIERMERFLN